MPATTLAPWCYANMFSECYYVTNAPELPATTLAQGCYYQMFSGCYDMTTAPELPATTLAEECYVEMFQGCTRLTMAPELPATTLVTSCYEGMFNNCPKLHYVKAAFTTTPGTDYTYDWLSGVSSAGVFYKKINATWTTTGTSGVPTGWTVIRY